LLVIKENWKWIVETKVFSNLSYFDKATRQLFQYLERSGENEGWLLFFSEYHEVETYERIELEDKIEHIWILPVKRQNPSES
jgi:hypothetical protein